MRLDDLFSQSDLQAQIEAGMVKTTLHPSGRLTILNYTQRAQYTPEFWNHVTDLCRGLIVDGAGNLVARAFRKFWNLEDARHPETLSENLPAAPPLLTRKLDGSLGVGYALDGTWHVATRGAFLSDQAVWASAWLEQNSPSSWPEGHTPVFEIVYPENRIVVRYEISGLILLALIKIDTGEELPYPELIGWGERNRIPVVDSIERPLSDCVAEDWPNEEGYVASWPRPGDTPLRVKIKYATYVRLHRLLTQTNAVTVWEMLRDHLDIAALTVDVPADFRAWIDAMQARFKGAFKAIEDDARAAFAAYTGSREAADPEAKKAFALWVMANHPSLAAILFAMISGKNYSPIVWKLIRPRGDEEKTFKVDEE